MPPSMDSLLLFVYGTLKRGHQRQDLLGGQQFLQVACTELCYVLYHCGNYPALVPAAPGKSGASIEGELWQLERALLPALDAWEAVDERLFERRPVKLRAPFTEAEVSAYFYLANTAGLPIVGAKWTLAHEQAGQPLQ